MKIELNESQVDIDNLSFTAIENAIVEADSASDAHNEMRVPLYLNKKLLEAITKGASDIHFEPYAEKYRIRFRIDGVMQETAELPRGFGHLLSTRLKVIAGLDISEQYIGQSGRFRMNLGTTDQQSIDFRCSVIPTLHGETLNLRVLYLPESVMQLGVLGLDSGQVDPILYNINRLQGMILVVGPTGSGKTVTLYTLLKHINSQPRSVFTVEDPVEIELDGINQINVSADNNFSQVSRTLLRQDPDVIMLGEIRDKETALTAVKAAHTGHLVLSTLHATSASKAIPRLMNLGVKVHDIASILSLVISQRLLRCLDPASRVEISVPKERLLAVGFAENELDDLTIYQAVPNENNNGYSGRTGIYQVMQVNGNLSKLIAEGATDDEIDTYLMEHDIQDMRRSALNKVREGVTDIEEIERVLGCVEVYDTTDQCTNCISEPLVAETKEPVVTSLKGKTKKIASTKKASTVKAKQKNAGFTLVELLVVVAILAAMSGIATTALGSYEQRARGELVLTEMKRISNAILKFNVDTGYFPKQGIYAKKINSVVDKSDIGFLFYSPRNNGADANSQGNEKLPWDAAANRGWNGPYLSMDSISYMRLADCEKKTVADDLRIFPVNATREMDKNSIIALEDTFSRKVTLNKETPACFIVNSREKREKEGHWTPKEYTGSPYHYEIEFRNDLYPECQKSGVGCVALLSAGKNGKYENGNNDDIIKILRTN